MPTGQFSATHARPRLVRRLRTLRNLEWFNVPFLVVALSVTWSPSTLDTVWQRLLAYALVAALLGVGGWYWHLKMLEISLRRPITGELAWFHRVERAARYLLVAASVALVVSWAAAVGATADRGWATGFLLLAWAEYVNYFHVQVMHDTRSDLDRLRRTRRLRPSWLASDLSAWRSESVR